MSQDKESRLGDQFGELHYKHGRTFDGISRSPGALTAELTYRAVLGHPEVYLTCIYRWRELPVAKYVSSQGAALGKRLGKNVLILPVDGDEEPYFADALNLIRAITGRYGDPLELADTQVLLLMSGCHPRSLLEQPRPCLLLDVSSLTAVEFVGCFSKILDLFDVELESNFFSHEVTLGPTAGRTLLASAEFEATASEDLEGAVQLLAELAYVLDGLKIRFVGFSWAIDERFRAALGHVGDDAMRREKLERARNHFADLRTAARALDVIGGIASDRPARESHVVVEDVIMGNKYVSNDGSNVVVHGDVTGGVINVGDRSQISHSVRSDAHYTVTGNAASGPPERARPGPADSSSARDYGGSAASGSMNKGQAFAIAATLSGVTVTLFFNGHHYTSFGFGLAALVFASFALSIGRRRRDVPKAGAKKR